MLERSRLERRNLTRTATVLLLSIALGVLGPGVHAEDAKQAGPGDLAAATPDQSSTATSHADLAKQATDPTAILTQLQLQNIFVPSSNDADGLKANGYANTFIIQPVIPIGKSENFPLDLVIRPTLPIVTTPDFESKDTGQTISSDTTDLGDLSVIAPFLKSETWGKWGVGPALTFPTATDKRTGASKWQAGPVVAVVNNSVEKWTLGVLGWNQTSFASSRSGEEDVNMLFFQPLAVHHFSEGWYAGWGDLPFTFDWKRDGHADIPLNARVGKVLKVGEQPINTFVQPFYTIDHAGAGSPDWGFKVNLTFLFPELKWQF